MSGMRMRPYPKMEPPAHREKDMKVLALGMSRTGTMSLFVALQKLGYNCYHMAECCLDFRNDSCELWHQAIDAKFNGKGVPFAGEDFDKMLWRYDAVSDSPCILFVDELLEAYPDAKVVITSRPVEGWHRSVINSFYPILNIPGWGIMQKFDGPLSRHYIPILKDTLAIWTGTTWRDQERLPLGFDAHYKHLREVTAAKGREVLEFRVQNGWEPLCKFLGKEIPKEPFPHINEGDSVVAMNTMMLRIRMLVVLKKGLKRYVLPLMVVGAALWWLKQRV